MKKETAGQRVYLVRLARGDGVKRPEKLEDFAAALVARGARYDASTLSRMENGTRKVTLEDCEAIAPLDPLQRGEAWLAFGGAKKPAEVAGQFEDDIEAGAVALTPAQIQRAVEKSARNEAARRAAQTAQSASPRKRKGTGGR